MYNGLFYNNITNTYPCSNAGLKAIKAVNQNIKGLTNDFSCGNFSCSGINCLVDTSIIPIACFADKNVLGTNPEFYISLFPSIKEMLSFCKSTKMYVLYDFYDEGPLLIKNTKPNVNMVFSGIGSGGKCPIILGNSHLIQNIYNNFTITIDCLTFINNDQITSPSISLRDDYILSVDISNFISNLYFTNNTFFGITFINTTTLNPITVNDWYNIINLNYFLPKSSGINPPIRDVNTDILVFMTISKYSIIQNNNFYGSFSVGYKQINLQTKENITIGIDNKLTTILYNVGEEQFGVFMDLTGIY